MFLKDLVLAASMVALGATAASNLIGNFQQNDAILVQRHDYEELERRVRILEARRKFYNFIQIHNHYQVIWDILSI